MDVSQDITSECQPVFPDCWNDDERMDYLFSEFPVSKDINPDDWNTKYEFWSNLILTFCHHNPSVIANVDTIKKWLCRNGRPPLGFDTVWQHMLHNKKMIPLSQFNRHLESNLGTWLDWGVDMVLWKPMDWLVNKLSSPIRFYQNFMNADKEIEHYICWEAFLTKTNQTLLKLQMTFDKSSDAYTILPLNEAKTHISHILEDGKSQDLVLKALVKQKYIVLYEYKYETDDNDTVVYNKYVKIFNKDIHEKLDLQFSECDKASIHLQTCLTKLLDEVESIEVKQNQLKQSATQALKDKHRSKALQCLRKKKKLDHRLQHCYEKINNITVLKERIEQGYIDSMLYKTYKVASSALKDFYSKELDKEDVNRTMDDLQDTLDTCKDVNDSIASFSHSLEQYDEDELLKELDALSISSCGNPDTSHDNNLLLNNIPDALCTPILTNDSDLKNVNYTNFECNPVAL